MKKHFKVIILTPIIIVLLFALLFGYNILFGGYNYETDIDCVNNTIFDYQVDNVIYKYENEKNEILLYNSKSGRVFQCLLKKRKNLDKIEYKLKYSATAVPITYHKEWAEVDKNLRYIFTDYENDIEDIDCDGFEPIGTKIYYHLSDGTEESCWIYVIDETNMDKK